MYGIGESARFTKTVSESDVYLFAGITGDLNPAHVNEEEAKTNLFGKRIVHGILITGFISTVIGMHLPGQGTIYMEQNWKFLKPVYIGDTVSAIVEITDIINKEKNILKLSTKVMNQNGQIVMDGFAVVKAPDR